MPPSLRFRLLALFAAVSAWGLVAVGGIVRVTESGLGCPDWPLCEGRAVPAGGQREALIEFSHRATAAVVTLLVVVVAAWAWRRYRLRRDILVPALIAVALVPLQAVLGAIVVWLELPAWIVGVHFVVGMLFLAASVLVVAAAWRPRRPAATRGFARLAWVSVGAGLLLVAAGVAVVTAEADDACGEEWPTCNGALVAGGSDAVLQVVHRSLAYVVAALAFALAVLAWRGAGPRLAAALPLTAIAGQLGIGVAMVLAGHESGAHTTLAALHVAGAGAVWASLVALAALTGGAAQLPAPETPAAHGDGR